MAIAVADIPDIPDYQTDPLPFASHSATMSQSGLEELMHGLLSPTQQRLMALFGYSGDGEAADQLAGDAFAELNHYFGLVPKIGAVAKEGYLRLVDETIVTPGGVMFAHNIARTAVVSMNVFAKLPQSYPSSTLPNLMWSNTPGLSVHSTAKGDGLVVKTTDTTERDYRRVQQSKSPDLKWHRSVGRTVQFLDVLFAQLFDRTAAAGIINLGSVLGDVARGSAQKAIDGSRTTTYFTPPPRERHPELAPPKLAKPNVVAPTTEVNDSEATRLLEELGLQPLGSKALKGHPLFAVLKKGAEVTLGSVHRFGGFGDNAGFAAAFVDRMASIVEGSEPEAIETLAQQVAEAKRLVTTRITPEAKYALALFVDVATQCSQHNFCQVAKNHAPQVHPTVRLAVQRLTLLREQMSLQMG